MASGNFLVYSGTYLIPGVKGRLGGHTGNFLVYSGTYLIPGVKGRLGAHTGNESSTSKNMLFLVKFRKNYDTDIFEIKDMEKN